MAIADVNWNTGISLAESAATEYWALVSNASKHDDLLRTHQQEQQKTQELERQARLAEQQRVEIAAEERRRGEFIANSQKRLAEYRSVAAELNGHQSAVCRRIVPSGIKYLFDSTTEVDDSAERAFKMILELARTSKCL